MARLRNVSESKSNKPPVLTAARRILIEALRRNSTSKPMGEMAEFVNGTSYRTDLLTEDGTPIIRISNITDPESAFLKTKESFEDKYKVDTGDLLVSWSASFKSIIWPGPSSILNQHIFRVRERSHNNRSFIRHAIEAVFDEMQQKVVGIGMMHLRRQDFIGHEIPCPSLDMQLAVGEYLDWIESDCNGQEPSLPKLLDQQHRMIRWIEELATKINEGQKLRRESLEAFSSVITSLHVSLSGQRTRALRDVLTLDERRVPIRPDGSYPQVGIKGFGGGLFARGVLGGTETTYREFNLLFDGALVLSQVKGWEGAIAVCDKRFAGLYASPEYRTFSFISDEALPEYMSAIVSSPWFYGKLADLTRGVGARRERTRPEAFLEMKISMPTIEHQRRALQVFQKLNTLKKIQSETAVELDALMPSILSKAFRGELRKYA